MVSRYKNTDMLRNSALESARKQYFSESAKEFRKVSYEVEDGLVWTISANMIPQLFSLRRNPPANAVLSLLSLLIMIEGPCTVHRTNAFPEVSLIWMLILNLPVVEPCHRSMTDVSHKMVTFHDHTRNCSRACWGIRHKEVGAVLKLLLSCLLGPAEPATWLLSPSPFSLAQASLAATSPVFLLCLPSGGLTNLQ